MSFFSGSSDAMSMLSLVTPEHFAERLSISPCFSTPFVQDSCRISMQDFENDSLNDPKWPKKSCIEILHQILQKLPSGESEKSLVSAEFQCRISMQDFFQIAPPPSSHHTFCRAHPRRTTLFAPPSSLVLSNPPPPLPTAHSSPSPSRCHCRATRLLRPYSWYKEVNL